MIKKILETKINNYEEIVKNFIKFFNILDGYQFDIEKMCKIDIIYNDLEGICNADFVWSLEDKILDCTYASELKSYENFIRFYISFDYDHTRDKIRGAVIGVEVTSNSNFKLINNEGSIHHTIFEHCTNMFNDDQNIDIWDIFRKRNIYLIFDKIKKINEENKLYSRISDKYKILHYLDKNHNIKNDHFETIYTDISLTNSSPTMDSPTYHYAEAFLCKVTGITSKEAKTVLDITSWREEQSFYFPQNDKIIYIKYDKYYGGFGFKTVK